MMDKRRAERFLKRQKKSALRTSKGAPKSLPRPGKTAIAKAKVPTRARRAARRSRKPSPGVTGQAPDLMRLTFESLRHALLVLDKNLTVVSVNRAFCETFRTTPEEASRKSVDWLLDPKCDSTTLKEYLRRTLSQEPPKDDFLIECKLARSGKRLMLLNARRLNQESKSMLILVAFQDVTEQKRMEDELRVHQWVLEDFIENAPVGVHWAAEDGRILWANRSELEMFGYTNDEYVGHDLREFYIDPDVVEEVFQRLLRHETVEHFEAAVRCKDGRTRYVSISANARWDNGRFVHTRCFTRDITESRLAEEAIRQMNQLLEQRVEERTQQLKESHDEMETFCYTIAHDLRAPLRAMEGFANALLEDCGPSLPPQGQEYLQRVVSAARREDRLIQDLLEYNQLRLITLACGPTHLDPIVDVAVEAVRAELQRRQGTIEVVRPLGEAIAHGPRLQHVFVHLISNALKFTRDNVPPDINIWSDNRENWVRIWVQDNGIGIAPQHHKRIFRVFERLHSFDRYPGTGVGLALVAKSIEKMEGQVGLESQLEVGSKFWIELKAVEPIVG